VYINIGSCSEACWTNHITDLRQIDPAHRGFGQSPVDIGQCRRDCPNFRAIEDRLPELAAFVTSARPTDLYTAQKLDSRSQLIEQLDSEFGENAVERGRQIFARDCASCHSSQDPPGGDFSSVDFHALDPSDPSLRIDWLGDDEMTPASQVGTYLSRALHSNHKQGHVFEEYGSETLRDRKVDPTLPVPADGGLGYYRNISLLSLWAHAPFMHNNAIGPELCGKPRNPENDFYRSPYVDQKGKPQIGAPACWSYDPSVEGRYRLFKASVDALLNPGRRVPKITTLDEDIVIAVGPRIERDGKETGIGLVIPAGLPVAYLGNLDHKGLVADIVNVHVNPKRLDEKYASRLDAAEIQALADELREMTKGFKNSSDHLIQGLAEHKPMLEKYYLNSTATVENVGHDFGEGLSDTDKRALTAFMATL
jgi:mono/diheme cytochrome c family protein